MNEASAAMSASSLQISIIVPTYREAENLSILVERIDGVLTEAGYTYEVIIADDESGDGTREICAELAEKFPLRLLSRTAQRGLSAAVLDGITLARGEALVVMDADLSHPPEKIPELATLLLSGESDFVLGSRYVRGGGTTDEWPFWRLVNSLLATYPARPLAPLADPMSGFFGLRRADMPPPERLSPIGYKIGLELVVKGNFSGDRVREVPILFSDRLHGESKLNLREQMNYLKHLGRLYRYRFPKITEFSLFISVGLLGLLVDIIVYASLHAVGMPHLLARAVSYWPAVTSNWFFNRILTFKERPKRPLLTQWLQFAIVCGLGFVVNWGTYALLTTNIDFFHNNLLVSLMIGVGVGTVFNFVFADRIVFKGANFPAKEDLNNR